MNKIIRGDCRKELKKLKQGSVHLIVTSPSYPMIKKWDCLYKKIDFNYQHNKFLFPVWKECYRVLVDGGMACINIGDATRSVENIFQCFPNYCRVVMDCVGIGFVHLIPIYWKKISTRPNAFLGSGFLPTNGYIAQDCEYIAILRKGGPRKFEPKDVNRYASAFTKEERDLWFRQIWEIKGRRGAKKTSAFPDEIPHRLIRMFSVIGDTVIDPFLGTGTTGNVAEKLGRNFIGYELK